MMFFQGKNHIYDGMQESIKNIQKWKHVFFANIFYEYTNFYLAKLHFYYRKNLTNDFVASIDLLRCVFFSPSFISVANSLQNRTSIVFNIPMQFITSSLQSAHTHTKHKSCPWRILSHCWIMLGYPITQKDQTTTFPCHRYFCRYYTSM